MLKIVTLNLNYYVEKHGPWEVRKKLILDVLNEQAPDIILFQAVARHPDAFGGKDQAQQLAEELNGFKTHYFQEAQVLPDGLVQGSAIISKYHTAETSFLGLSLKPGLEDNTHRVVLRTTFEGKRGKVDIYNAHFSWVTDQARANSQETVNFMNGANEDLLLGGDLNTPPGSEVFLPFTQRGLSDVWARINANVKGNTFEAGNPSVRIDYFWASPSLMEQVRKLSVIGPPQGSSADLSDHLGLLIELDRAL